MRANQAQIVATFAFRPLSLRIIISFSFVFAQAYASSEHRREDT
jgi:hypothetical protein